MAARLNLGTFPTPLHRLELLSEELGIDLWMKRDDLTGFALGGNKVREVEFILADAVQQDADMILTAGTYQSNHARVIAAASRRCRMECHLFLSGEESKPPTGNLLLDYLAEARIHPVASRAERTPAMETFAAKLKSAGHKPYVVPIGGANAFGAHGYVEGFRELEDQVVLLPRKHTILVFSSSTGATYAGMLVARMLRKSEIDILGIRTDLDPDPESTICGISNALAEQLGRTERVGPEDVHLNSGYVGEAFNVPTKEGVDALRLLWQLEGILLEPVYTAKGMAGLIDLARKGTWKDERVIFLHTGGAPTTFSFAELLSNS